MTPTLTLAECKWLRDHGLEQKVDGVATEAELLKFVVEKWKEENPGDVWRCLDVKIVECDALPAGTVLLVSSPVDIPTCETWEELMSYFVGNRLAAAVVNVEMEPAPPREGVRG